MMNDKYVLKGRTPTLEFNKFDWAKWFEKPENRRVAFDRVGSVSISTTFLGVDHGYRGGRPVLFETMIFGGEFDGFQERYCTYEEAEWGHDRIVSMVRGPKVEETKPLPKQTDLRRRLETSAWIILAILLMSFIAWGALRLIG